MRLPFVIAVAFVAFAPVSATADTQSEQQACIGDAFSVCGHAIPDRDRVAACLAQNISRLSVGCRTVMQRYARPMAQRAKLSTHD